MTTEPTPLSYAILGLLALRPWTGYELAQQTDRNLRYMWGRSERSVYTEPKRLVALGWARERQRATGRREATEYRITPAGRKALRAWLATPPDEPPMRLEALLRTFFADAGTTADLVNAVDASVEQWRARLAVLAPIVREYAEGGGLFPERAHLVALLADFSDRFVSALEDWTDEVKRAACGWDSPKDVGLDDDARRRMERFLERRGDCARST